MTTSLNKDGTRAERAARELAMRLHAGQAWGPFSYIVHLDRVYACLAEAGQGEALRVAAYLHDALEDTALTQEEISLQFGDEVARLVDAVSGFGADRQAKQQCIVAKLRAHPAAIPLKMADRVVNMQFCLETGRLSLLARYRQEHLEMGYRDLFCQGPKSLWQRYETLLPASLRG